MPITQTYFPQFSEIDIESIEPALDHVLAKNRTAINALVAQPEFRWEALIDPLVEIEDRLHQLFAPLSHLNSVKNSPALRKAYEACLPKLSAYSAEIGQNHSLYQAYASLKAKGEFDSLNPIQQKIINDALRDFKLAGVALDTSNKSRYIIIEQRLAKLSNQFSNNVLDATQAWHYQTQDEHELAGLPNIILQTAKAVAAQKKKPGWVLTLDAPCYIAVMTYADNAKLREKFYRAFTTRACEQSLDGKFDNSNLMVEIVNLRDEKAKLLGFKNFSAYSIADKMAKSETEVVEFLNHLAKTAKPQAEKELLELQAFAQEQFKIDQLNAWDIAYYSEKLKYARFHFSEEELRPYFNEPNVIDGLFSIIEKLYGIHVEPMKGIDVWHKDVACYHFKEASGHTRGYLYVDLYARSDKRGGAWMDVCQQRRYLKNGSLQHPIAYLNCNFNPPVDGVSLLTHDEVVTLFHECGHCLHHILSQVDFAPAAGIDGVEWDAVELPSQFFENWCWQADSLALFAKHYQTGEPLPNKMLDNLIAAKNFQSAMQMMRQLEFSLFDFKLHQQMVKDVQTIQTILDDVRQQVAVNTPPDFNRFQHSFTHIFAGGYAAGYYSYKWAEVLAADAFSRFIDEGIFNQKTAKDFLSNVLECGSSKPALELFVAFRGREAKVDALLKQNGITQ